MKVLIGLLCLLSMSWGLMLQVPDSLLMEESSYIVRGKVISKNCQWVNQGKTIFTFVEIEIQESFKGGFQKSKILTVTVPGGFDPELNRGIKVSDQPEYEIGEEAVLFLNEAKGENDGINYEVIYDKVRIDCYRTNFLYQGKNNIVYDDVLKTEVVHKANDGKKVSLKKYKAEIASFSNK